MPCFDSHYKYSVQQQQQLLLPERQTTFNRMIAPLAAKLQSVAAYTVHVPGVHDNQSKSEEVPLPTIDGCAVDSERLSEYLMESLAMNPKRMNPTDTIPAASIPRTDDPDSDSDFQAFPFQYHTRQIAECECPWNEEKK